MTMAVYTRDASASVYALSGAEVSIYQTGDDPSEVIDPLVRRNDIQLVLVEDTILIEYADYFHTVCMTHDQPLLVGVPSITATEPVPSLVVSMVNRALGLTAEGGLS